MFVTTKEINGKKYSYEWDLIGLDNGNSKDAIIYRDFLG